MTANICRYIYIHTYTHAYIHTYANICFSARHIFAANEIEMLETNMAAYRMKIRRFVILVYHGLLL